MEILLPDKLDSNLITSKESASFFCHWIDVNGVDINVVDVNGIDFNCADLNGVDVNGVRGILGVEKSHLFVKFTCQ